MQTQKAYKQASDFLKTNKCSLIHLKNAYCQKFQSIVFSFFRWYVFPFQLVQSATLSLENIFLEKPQEEGQIDDRTFLGLKRSNKCALS